MLQSPVRHRISDRSKHHVGRHRLVTERVILPSRDAVRRALRSRTAVVASALTCLALAATAGEIGPPPGSLGSAGSASVFSGVLAPADPDAPVVDAAPLVDPAADAARAAEEVRLAAEAAWRANNPTPVAGLDQAQMNNALRIVQTGQAMGLPKRAYVIAVATAMQESRLYNLASRRVAESYSYWHEGSGSDHDSVGLFQQRPSTGWGRVQDLMDPFYAAKAFYSSLVRVPGWESMSLTWAAQRVQISAYPYAYAKHEARAQQVVDALVPEH